MRVTLSQNGKEITSRDFKAVDKVRPELNVDEAIRCLSIGFRLEEIDNFEAVEEEFRRKNQTIGNSKYLAEVSGDIWEIDIRQYFCPDCGWIVDNDGDLCEDCKAKKS